MFALVRVIGKISKCRWQNSRSFREVRGDCQASLFQEIHLNEHLWMVGPDPSTQQLEAVQGCLYGGDFCIF